jgi:hypothetical protein
MLRSEFVATIGNVAKQQVSARRFLEVQAHRRPRLISSRRKNQRVDIAKNPRRVSAS